MKKCSKCGEEKDASCFYVGRNACKQCEILRSCAYVKKHKPAYAKLMGKWRDRNPHKYLLSNLRSSAKRDGYLPPHISPERLKDFIRDHSGICDMEKCAKVANNLDHSHKTGSMRGWLCHNHNMGLGSFHDSIDEILDAAEYLVKDLDIIQLMEIAHAV